MTVLLSPYKTNNIRWYSDSAISCGGDGRPRKSHGGSVHANQAHPSFLTRGRRFVARLRRAPAGPCPGQDQNAIQFFLQRTGSARRRLQGVRGRNKGWLRRGTVLAQLSVQAGYRVSRSATRQSRDVQSRPRGYREADSSLVVDDFGVPVSRRRSLEEDIQERRG